MELAAGEVFRRPEGYLIHTYVSNYQYVFLKETAAAQRMSVEGMLTAAAELLVGTDDEGSGYHIPESLGRIADRVLEVRGSTLEGLPPAVSGEHPHEHYRFGPYRRLHGKARHRLRP